MKYICIILLYCLTGHITASPTNVSWYDLMDFNTDVTSPTNNPTIHENKEIKIVGFIVPLIDEITFDKISEFYLVPDPMMCIHVPAPPPNQMIHVKMKKPIPLDIDFEGVWIKGTLKPIKGPIEYGNPGFILMGNKGWACKDYPYDEFLDPWPDLDLLEI